MPVKVTQQCVNYKYIPEMFQQDGWINILLFLNGIQNIRRILIEEEHVPLDKPCEGYWEELSNLKGDFHINNGDFVYIK